MLKVLKLQKAVYLLIVGVLALIVSQVMKANDVQGSSLVLGISGAFFIIGALLFLYPILFAKKADPDGKNVELQPIGEEESET